MFEWFQNIAPTIILWLEQGNPLFFGALFLITVLIEIAIPIPLIQDSVLLYVGYEPTGRLLSMAPLVMATLMAGRICGGSIIFWIARSLCSRFTVWLGRKSPKILCKAQSLGARMEKRTTLAVAIARLTPGLLTASTVAAGLFQVKYLYFCAGVVISSLIPDCGEIAAGLAIKTGFTIAGITPSPALFIIAFIVVMALIWLGNRLWARRRKPNGVNSKTP